MRSRGLLLVQLLLIFAPSLCFADGKFYARRLLDLPNQQAMVFFNGTEEMLVIQSKYVGDVEEFGWVIPVPALPTLASLDAEPARELFWILAYRTMEEVVPVGSYIGMAVFGASVLLGVVLSFVTKGAAPGCLGVGILVLALIAVPQFGTHRKGVQVLTEQAVGAYDVKVIRGDDSKALIDWLKERKYGFDEKDEGVFDTYVNKGWCFVTARIARGERGRGAVSSQGMVNPLIARFPSSHPVYPMALTGTAGSPVKLVLYAISPFRLDADTRLETTYAGQSEAIRIAFDMMREARMAGEGKSKTASQKILVGFEGCTYLTKFEAKLTPDKMKEDFVLARAESDSPYRARKTGPLVEAVPGVSVALMMMLLYAAHVVVWRIRKKKERAKETTRDTSTRVPR